MRAVETSPTPRQPSDSDQVMVEPLEGTTNRSRSPTLVSYFRARD
jgi:hypothetical protein